MIVNGSSLILAAPIKDMLRTKEKAHGVSHGLTEAGYDLRIRQDIYFEADGRGTDMLVRSSREAFRLGRFTLASAIEEFQMPTNLVGKVHDKSTWARRGLSVFNTVIEPGFRGGLTLELVYHGQENLHIPAGAGIAQVLFFETAHAAQYAGKYQGQSSEPVPAIHEPS